MATCAQHTDVQASYRCEGCEKLLCDGCIDESHTLLLCRLCGERGVPLDNARPADTRQLAKARIMAKPYTLQQTLLYPFRMPTTLMFIMALAVVGFSNHTSLWAMLFMTALLAALQFHIARKTVQGDNELHEWPDFTAWNDLIPDLIAWVFLELPLKAILGIYLAVGFFSGIMRVEPSLLSAILLAVALWLGCAYQVMGFGVVGNHSLRHLFAIHCHVIGFKKTLGDALKYTNLIFALRVLYTLIGMALASEGANPLFGIIIGTVLEGYWLFMTAHLSGLLYRRHEEVLDDLYLNA